MPALVVNCAIPAWSQARFHSVGSVEIGRTTAVSAISLDGTAVVGRLFVGSETRAMRWTEGGGLQDLGELPGAPPGSYYDATAVSADGRTVYGFAMAGSATSAFRWTAETGMTAVARTPSGYWFAVPVSVSADGLVTCGWAVSTLAGSFRWTEFGGFEYLDDLGGGNTVAEALSSDGAVIVGSSRAAYGHKHAFRWTAPSGVLDLGGLTDCYASGAVDVSSGGDFAVGWSAFCNGESQPRAVLWTINGIVGLGSLTELSCANAVTTDGTTIVGWSGERYDSYEPAKVATIWRRSPDLQVRSVADVLTTDYGLDLTGWSLKDALAISSDGNVLAGRGVDPLGRNRGWVAILSDPLPFTPEECRGDLNGDESIDLADVGLILSQFGAAGTQLVADTNGDGLVDLVDLNAVLSEFGTHCE